MLTQKKKLILVKPPSHSEYLRLLLHQHQAVHELWTVLALQLLDAQRSEVHRPLQAVEHSSLLPSVLGLSQALESLSEDESGSQAFGVALDSLLGAELLVVEGQGEVERATLSSLHGDELECGKDIFDVTEEC